MYGLFHLRDLMHSYVVSDDNDAFSRCLGGVLMMVIVWLFPMRLVVLLTLFVTLYDPE